MEPHDSTASVTALLFNTASRVHLDRQTVRRHLNLKQFIPRYRSATMGVSGIHFKRFSLLCVSQMHLILQVRCETLGNQIIKQNEMDGKIIQYFREPL